MGTRLFAVKVCRMCGDGLGEYRVDLGEWLCDDCDLKEYQAKMEDLGIYPPAPKKKVDDEDCDN